MNGLARSNAAARTTDRGTLPLSVAFDRLWQNSMTPMTSAHPQPAVKANIWETDEAYQIALLVPGANPESIEVTTHGNALTVSGSIETPQPESAKAIWREFGGSTFTRRFGLPAGVNSEGIEAAYQHGILLLKLPKAEHAKPRQIKVQTA